MKETQEQRSEISNGASPLDAVRHSLAHLLAMAVLKKFPKAKLGIGPVIDTGFYYDFLIAARIPFTGKKTTAPTAKKLFKDQPFKLDLIKEFAKEKKELTVYTTGKPVKREGLRVKERKSSPSRNTSPVTHGSFKIGR